MQRKIITVKKHEESTSEQQEHNIHVMGDPQGERRQKKNKKIMVQSCLYFMKIINSPIQEAQQSLSLREMVKTILEYIINASKPVKSSQEQNNTKNKH